MRPIPNFENVQAFTNIENLPAGGYICEIKKAAEKPNRNGGSHIEVLFDIKDGEHAGWFEKDYRAQNREDKFWRGIYNQNVPNENGSSYEMQLKFLKSFVNAVEESNPGYHWDWNEAGLKGKKIGVIFGEREKLSGKGRVYTVTNAAKVVSVKDIENGNFEIPEKKLLPASQKPVDINVGFEAIDEDNGDLPF